MQTRQLTVPIQVPQRSLMTVGKQHLLRFRIHLQVDYISFIQQIQNAFRLVLSYVSPGKEVQVMRGQAVHFIVYRP